MGTTESRKKSIAYLRTLADSARSLAAADAPADLRPDARDATYVAVAVLHRVGRLVAEEMEREPAAGQHAPPPCEELDATVLKMIRALGTGQSAAADWGQLVGSVRESLGDDPRAAAATEMAREVEGFFLRILAALKRTVDGHVWASDNPLTARELAHLKRYDDRQRAATASPLALAAGGAAAAAGMWLAGPVGAGVLGVAVYLAAAVAGEYALRRVVG